MTALDFDAAAERFASCDLIAFDLDGTLLASHEFAPAAAQRAFARLMERLALDHDPPSVETIRERIGKPWREFYSGLLPEEAREHYAEFHAGISLIELDAIRNKRAQLFDGAERVLQTLTDRGYRLALISNASTDYFETVIESFDLRRFFRYTECLGDREGTLKHRMVQQAMRELGGQFGCVVGDKAADFEAASVLGFPSVAMRHGYGGPDEWRLATIALDTLPDLLHMLPDRLV